jgi:hypothetical protein
MKSARKNTSSSAHRSIDTIGAFASFLCAAHCMALPLILTVLPLAGLGIFYDHSFELVVLLITVSLATASLCWGTRIHGDRRVLLFIASAILFFTISHELNHGQWTHAATMFLGGLSLVAGHLINRKLCSSCHECECPGH